MIRSFRYTFTADRLISHSLYRIPGIPLILRNFRIYMQKVILDFCNEGFYLNCYV